MKIGIIGAGMSGLATAYRLSQAGHNVTVFDRAEQPGGLATWADHGPFVFDKYYHVILPTDRYLISFLEDLGLADELLWSQSLTGFFVDEKIHSMSNALEFLRFPALSLIGKARLAFTILYCSRINDWKRLENVGVAEWLEKLSGKATYEKLWKPLLLAKLGENYRRVSAVFIWTYIKRMFSARDTSASREQMGHVRGGYKTVFTRAIQAIEEAGSQVRLGVDVRKITAGSNAGIDVQTGNGTESFDKVIFTGPVNALQAATGDGLVSVEGSGEKVEYLGVLCMALVTKKPLMPFYILNIADSRVPFTGVVGMTSITEPAETNGLHLAYLPKYVLSTDAELQRPDDELQREFIVGLKIVFPDFDESTIVSSEIHRAIKVQPLQVKNFSSLIPSSRTLHPDFFVLNTAQFVNNTLNNNEVIRAVNAFVETHGASLAEPASPAPRISEEAVA